MASANRPQHERGFIYMMIKMRDKKKKQKKKQKKKK